MGFAFVCENYFFLTGAVFKLLNMRSCHVLSNEVIRIVSNIRHLHPHRRINRRLIIKVWAAWLVIRYTRGGEAIDYWGIDRLSFGPIWKVLRLDKQPFIASLDYLNVLRNGGGLRSMTKEHGDGTGWLVAWTKVLCRCRLDLSWGTACGSFVCCS
jgi:hypothetical protein